MVHVIAKITVDPARREDFLSSFAELKPKVEAEDGCIEYGAAVDTPTELPPHKPAGDNAVMVLEKWEDVAKLEAHLAAPHMEAFREANAGIMQNVELMVLKPAS